MSGPVIYRARAAGWSTNAKVHTSTDVATKVVFPTSALGDFSIVLWARLRAADLDKGVFGDILQFNGAGGYPNAWLRLRTANYPSTGELLFQLGSDDSATAFDVIKSYVESTPGVRALPADTWRAIVVTFKAGDAMKLYLDGELQESLDVSTWATANPGTGTGGAFDGSNPTYLSFDGDLANVAFFTRELDFVEAAAFYGAGVTQDLTQNQEPGPGKSYLWFGETPAVYWRDKPTNGAAASVGSAGACDLGVSGYEVESTGSAADETPSSATKRQVTIDRWPPLHTLLKTGGTTNSRWQVLSPVVSRLFFPVGGGFGNAGLGLWWKRPASPVASAGTLLQVGAGLSSITVSLGGGNVPTVTVTDGTTSVHADLPPISLDRLQWLFLVSDNLGDVINVFLNGEAVATIDVSTLSPADVAWGLDFTIGTKTDGTSPLDVYFTGVSGFEEDVPDAGEIQWIGEAGWKSDIRNPYPSKEEGWMPPTTKNPDGESPLPVVYWPDGPNEEGVVPGAIEDTPPLVPFDASFDVVPGEIRSWWLGDHKIGIYSSAWFGNEAQDTAAWTLNFANAAHEDVFGECPRVVKVTARDDGALLLDLDAKAQPGIGYTLDGPDDLTGVSP